MKALFTSMLQALARGEGVVLCSILASSGSTPRGAGAKMAVFADGHTAVSYTHLTLPTIYSV